MPNVGFTYQLNTASLSGGTHTITAVAADTVGNLGSFSVNVTTPAPALPSVFIDSPAANAPVSGTIMVSGWAINNVTTIGAAISNVQIKVDGVLVGSAAYGTPRLDVCTVYAGRLGCPNVGFTYQLNTTSLALGTHTITAIATDTTGNLGSFSVNVTAGTQVGVSNGPPTVHIDSLASGAAISGTVVVSGWAIDNATSVGSAISSVQILVDGAVLGTATYGGVRGDVCAVYPGRLGCPNVGFTYQLNSSSLNTGAHTITALATDTDITPNTAANSISVTRAPLVTQALTLTSSANPVRYGQPVTLTAKFVFSGSTGKGNIL